jgi:hypothetical protein
MNKLKFTIIWCLLVGALFSCGKENEPAPVAEQDYFPTSKGSTWSYGGRSPYTITALGSTKVINGKSYHELENKQASGTQKSYLLKDNGIYSAIGLDANLGELAIIMLQENRALNSPWQHNSVLNGVDTFMTFTVEEKGGTKVVEGKTYTNVIKVKMVSTYKYMGIEFGVELTSYYYWSKGVGLILSDFGPLGQAPLLNYTIK